MDLVFCLVFFFFFFWYLECITGKEKCRVNLSINLILLQVYFPEGFLMKLEEVKKSIGEVGRREMCFLSMSVMPKS